MDRDELIKATKCLMPCSFMEYKVPILIPNYLVISIIYNFLQMTEDPVNYPSETAKSDGTVLLVPMFSSDKVQVLEEAEAFPFSSLVADIGGVLGLFVGFNFLMVWDWVKGCLRKSVLKVSSS